LVWKLCQREKPLRQSEIEPIFSSLHSFILLSYPRVELQRHSLLWANFFTLRA